MIHKVLTIQNPEGLRARPAAEFVQLASGFISQMLIEKGNKKVNAKSIMGVLSLGVAQGDAIHLFVTGPDEDIAMSAMVELTRRG
ncbi:HPr family phosphocarrier protein [Christensenellaceae bacterium OttesenSCG-928-L17]|nr:HPr family phosphocarrier protein [Christensenellaceae bacterium OttesenSCG-928-L17]